mmetsp:Transcript_32542/g.83182  ORF Transcript_32542/g.83182 Transcript_32542/m.83182 type:complete len:150 (-) Transcript_32542:6047-6496(-)
MRVSGRSNRGRKEPSDSSDEERDTPQKAAGKAPAAAPKKATSKKPAAKAGGEGAADPATKSSSRSVRFNQLLKGIQKAEYKDGQELGEDMAFVKPTAAEMLQLHGALKSLKGALMIEFYRSELARYVAPGVARGPVRHTCRRTLDQAPG